ncbi:MAG: tRNA (adenosine(37)-N6)-dimethylallyltransferase MiaA [Planctomycetota bacterium]
MTPRIPQDQPLFFLIGPTAAGKSALALEVAERAGAEILSLDSMQVYRGMDVGTAKPSAAERARVPQHLIDLVEPTERYHAHRYLEDAARAWHAVRERGRPALFVGGTGLYLKALTHGLFEGAPHDPELREDLNLRAAAEGSPALHAELSAVDPAAAARIHPNDAKRVVRGLEVFRGSGRRLSELQEEWKRAADGRPRTVVGVTPAPERLEQRIRARTRAMLAAGWIDEVRALLAAGGFGPTSAQALGYPEIRAHLAGELDAAELEAAIALRTRQFARRQRTWFRSFPETVWVDPEPDREAVNAKRAPEQVLQALAW